MTLDIEKIKAAAQHFKLNDCPILVNPLSLLELITQLEETKADLAHANSILIKIEKLLEGVEYRGDFAEGVRVLKDSLEAAETANDSAANIINELDKKLEAAEKQVESLTEELNNRCIEQYQLQEQVAQQAARIDSLVDTLTYMSKRDTETSMLICEQAAQITLLEAAEKDYATIKDRIRLMYEMPVINDTYNQVRESQDFAIDDIEYDMFSSGWRNAVALVIRTMKEKP